MKSKGNHVSRITHSTWLVSLFAALWPLIFASWLVTNTPSACAQVWITNSLTISETDTTYDGEDLIISGSGVIVAIDGKHGLNSLFITNGAVLSHSPCTTTATHKLDLNIVNGVLVDASSKIDVSALGYLPGRMSGNTTVGGATAASGGSYGGLGGGSGGGPNAVYGDLPTRMIGAAGAARSRMAGVGAGALCGS